MTTAIAVIGSNFGDEGKGLATDFFTRRLSQPARPPLVVRCNGGAQAGHTVVDGLRSHVFGHFGSGTFAGADTYLASKFIVNPLAYAKEKKKLGVAGDKTLVYASRECRVTTIYDMALNSLVELARDGQRHGSCGLGINETVTRHRAGYFLTIEQVLTESSFEIAQILQRIHDEWVPRRLMELGIRPDSFKPSVMKKAGLYFSMLGKDRRDIAVDMRQALASIRLEDPKSFNNYKQGIVIEGAQGLMLDEFLGVFPHVTRSITGLASHVMAAHECGYSNVQPIYMTRAYLTRHGNGALNNEGEVISALPLKDTTNVDNEWQGTLRYAPLDLDALRKFIGLDYKRGLVAAQIAGADIESPLLFVTCLDQIADSVQIHINGALEIIPTVDLLQTISDHVGYEVLYASHGPTANDVNVVTDIV